DDDRNSRWRANDGIGAERAETDRDASLRDVLGTERDHRKAGRAEIDRRGRHHGASRRGAEARRDHALDRLAKNVERITRRELAVALRRGPYVSAPVVLRGDGVAQRLQAVTGLEETVAGDVAAKRRVRRRGADGEPAPQRGSARTLSAHHSNVAHGAHPLREAAREPRTSSA